jgi:hypothetical protein
MIGAVGAERHSSEAATPAIKPRNHTFDVLSQTYPEVLNMALVE